MPYALPVPGTADRGESVATQEELTSVLDAVRDAVPTLRRNGVEAEDRRMIPDENIALLEKAGVFRAAVPRAHGGLDLDVAQQARIIAEVSRGCPSTGWLTMVWLTSTWAASLYPDRAQQEVFEGGSTRVSIVFAPTGTLTPADGGYRLDGTWRFNSGVRGAGWDMLAAMVEHPDGTSEELVALVPTGELSLADDWHVSAGAGTGSSTATATGVFVPAHRVVPLEEAMVSATGDRANTGATGRNYGLLGYIMSSVAATFLGMAQGAYELFVERLPGRAITYTDWTEQSLHPLTQQTVATAANKIDAARALSAGWQRVLQDAADAGEQPTDEQKAVIRGQTAFAAQLSKEAVELLFAASGGSVIRRDVPMQRFHRDIQGFSLHALVQLEANLEVQGRVLLGMDPGTYFL
ncbi:Acyl-CoA dehydrogenase type 2 domain protein [Streptomyces microflavus DSM 40593]|uniref:Acyl-CoA dehydrogenase type 2 domain protein n=1 Tax=Streptomyces microflavus DSM 40593 TaxID=1303692 RepID=N0CV42_STRMI|nr:Acyl-CoA dehydrogenase type 2 domain protein [Streptomyces microflavus DSM 40593]